MEITFCEYSETLRLMPMNYCLAYKREGYGYWLVDPDTAVSEDIHIMLVKYFRIFNNAYARNLALAELNHLLHEAK